VKRDFVKENKLNYENYVSTGSTLLDLAVSGGRTEHGGIPGGIIVEIYGPPGSGKTAILAEVCASSQARGGAIRFLDPEGRLDQEYSRIYGMDLPKEDYFRPDTVTEMFSIIKNWKPENKNNKAINVIAADSLAALSTELEMEDKDAYGMRRAKEFSEGLRKTTRIIANNNWLIICSNQIREGQWGKVTPGGKAIPFYSSLRIEVDQIGKVDQEINIEGKKVKRSIGIKSKFCVKKSTVDSPYRECDIFIIFGYGIDDIRTNLNYIKSVTGETKYDVFDGKYFKSMEKAILHIEKNKLEKNLKNKTIEMWRQLESYFKSDRKPKQRL